MGGCWSIGAKVLLLAGLAVVVFGIAVVRDASKCAGWEKAEGKIIGACIRDLPVPESKTRDYLTPDIVYEYAARSGKSYFSNRFSYIDTSLFPRISENYQAGSYENVKAFLSKYPVGKKVEVFYDPRHPSEAVLDRGLKMPVFVPLISGLLMVYASFHFFIFRRLAGECRRSSGVPAR